MMSLRPAPSDSLIANSRRLASARKSDIVATLTHAISSTKAAEDASMPSGTSM